MFSNLSRKASSLVLEGLLFTMFVAMAVFGLSELNDVIGDEKSVVSRQEAAVRVSEEVAGMNVAFIKEVKLAKDVWLRGKDPDEKMKYRAEFLEQRQDFERHLGNALAGMKSLEAESDLWSGLYFYVQTLLDEHRQVSDLYLAQIDAYRGDPAEADSRVKGIDRELSSQIDVLSGDLVNYVSQQSGLYISHAELDYQQHRQQVVIWVLSLFVVLGFIIKNSNKRAQMAEQRSMRLQEALDQHAIVSMADVSGKIIYVNNLFCQISGYSRDELLGRNHRILKSGLQSSEFFADMWGRITAGKIWSGDICNRKKDGELYWVYATIVPFVDEHGKPEEYIAIRTDITEQKRMEEAARAEQLRLHTILDNLGEGIYMLDAEGCLTYLNSEGERMLGWSYAELEGKRIHDIIHQHDSPATQECPIQQMMRDNRIYRSSDEIFLNRDGMQLAVKFTGAPILLDGHLSGSVAVFSDIRDEKLLQLRLIEAKNAAEEAVRLKSEFLSSMSHEIRTPLNGVIGMTDLLIDTPLDNEQTEFVRTIKMSADALLSIINDILDFSKIEAGALKLENIDFSLREVIEGSVDILAAKARGRDLTLASFVDAELPDRLIGDPSRIRQILLNFISNAIKFTEHGQIIVRADFDGEEGERIYVKLQVRDTGIGLANEAKERLFQPFSQADSSTSRKYGGTGLGLAISKRLAETMGGAIGVESESGQGAAFWVRIPFAAGREMESIQAPVQIRFVLLAGDSQENRALWGSYFANWNIRYSSLESYADLLQRLSALSGDGIRPDAVLLVEPLPDAGLDEVCSTLRAEGIPTVCCLSDPNKALRSRLDELDACVLQKPMKQSSLLDALMTLCSPRHSPVRAETPQEKAPQATDVELRILLAEDNPVNQRVAVHMLGKIGLGVDVVNNGEEAVAAAAKGGYALVLMDCQMPRMDGYEATALIRRSESGSSRHLPIIAMTANAMSGDREKCLQAGMDDYMSKPIEIGRLRKVLSSWLQDTPATPEATVENDGGTIIDMGRLRDLFGDDREGIIDLFALFKESLLSLREKMEREALEHGPNMKSLAHELKGSASNLGAVALSSLAERIEGLAAAGDWQQIGQLLAAADKEIGRAIDYIDKFGADNA